MALDSERFTTAGSKLLGIRDGAGRLLSSAAERCQTSVQPISSRLGLNSVSAPEPVTRVTTKLGKGGPWREAIIAWFNRQPVVRFISASLLRRILASNLIGFFILFLGILYLSLDSSWIINAKRDSLRTQGQIIAAAIAGSAMVKKGQILVDPDRLPATKNALIPFRDDGFAALQLSIRPEKVAPIFRRLIAPTNTRARIYDRRGNLVVDSSDLLRRGSIGKKPDSNSKTVQGSKQQRPTTKNFWTRLQHWLIDKEVQVYKEIGNANGQYYPEVRKAIKGEDAAMLLLNEKSEQIVSVAVPITRFKRVMGVLLLSTPPGEIDKVLAKSRSDLWPLALIALLASVATGLFLTRTVAGPMQRLSAKAEHASRDISARTALPDYADRKDEVGQMAQAFSAMTNSLYERIEASEKFAADVAHELKNPLTAASSMAQSLEYARTEEDREQVVQQIQHELRRLNRLISDVSRASMLNAQLQRETREPVELKGVLRDVVSIFEEKTEGSGIKLEFKAIGKTEEFIVAGTDGRLGQVFTNLIDNAISFSPEGGTVAVVAKVDGDDVVVTVDDQGPGIQEDKLETIFTRFYTYRPSEFSSRGNNSGLGLSISQEIIQAHNGRIWAENRYAVGDGNDGSTPVGARFAVRLPTMSPAVTRTRSRNV